MEMCLGDFKPVLIISLALVKLFFCLCSKAGSSSYINSPGILGSHLLRCGSRRNSETEAMGASPNSGLVFHPPELPEDTVMEVQNILIIL